MAGQSFVTANVWGQGRAAATLSHKAGRLQDGEEECMICREEVAASVAFQPCSHAVCFACVENMRAKNIFKVRERGESPERLLKTPPPLTLGRVHPSGPRQPHAHAVAVCRPALPFPTPPRRNGVAAAQADKGVKCPFCRGYIDGYRSLKK
jgi:hypothetical protein